MTILRHDAPVTRETAVCYRGRPLVVELHAGYLTLREKGRHQAVALDYAAAYECALRMQARERTK
jgi:hypothetical protein